MLARLALLLVKRTDRYEWDLLVGKQGTLLHLSAYGFSRVSRSVAIRMAYAAGNDVLRSVI